MTMMRISAKHPVRGVCYGLEVYHDCANGALRIIEDHLAGHNICIDRASGVAITGDEGSATFNLRPTEGDGMVCECCADRIDRAEYAHVLAFQWYTVRPGCVEINSYIS
jgi:hypothetical protein